MTNTLNSSLRWADTVRSARNATLAQVQNVENLAAPGVGFRSAGRVLILGPEHLVLLAADRLRAQVPVVSLVTEAMPESAGAELQAAADLCDPITPYRLQLLRLKGFLGQFQAEVEVQGKAENLAALAAQSAYFDTVLDLGREPRFSTERTPAGYFYAPDTATRDAALLQLPEMVGEFEKPRYFRQITDRCAHSRNGLTGCTRCLDACPADAISVQGGQIQIDAHLCHGAGGCATSCPTGAIRYGYPQPELTLELLRRRLQRFRELGGELPVVLVHDAAAGRDLVDQRCDDLPPNLLPLQVEELGAAGAEVWLAALAWGAGAVLLLGGEHVASSSLRTLAWEVKLTCTLLEGAGEPASSIALIDASEAHWLESLAQRCAPESLRERAACELRELSDKRALIGEALDALRAGTASQLAAQSLPQGAPYGEVVIDQSRCTLCMACVSSCPQGALLDGRGKPELRFLEQSCVQCGLCEKACPEQVISLKPRYLYPHDQRTTPRTLKAESPFHCIRCAKPFGTQGMVLRMLDKLAGHSMFQGAALKRLKMCEDCRVIDVVEQDPGNDLYRYAKGQEPRDGAINLAQVEEVK